MKADGAISPMPSFVTLQTFTMSASTICSGGQTNMLLSKNNRAGDGRGIFLAAKPVSGSLAPYPLVFPALPVVY